uniref:Uncharacterized protein n=1 Tax=Oryza brachyantha TaxID=4533 RepID=J3MWY1_ORYBR
MAIRTHAFWDLIGFNPGINQTNSLMAIRRPNEPPKKHFKVFFTLCFRELWIHRNGVVFQGEAPSIHRCLRQAISDTIVWAKRIPTKDKIITQLWKTLLQNALHSVSAAP